MSSLRMWWIAARPFSLTVSFVPPIFGVVIVAYLFGWNSVNLFSAILCLAGCMLAHAGSNLLSDYFDFKNGVDRNETFGSCRLLVEGKLKPVEALMAAGVSFGSAALIGFYFVMVSPGGYDLIPLIVIGAFLALFYTAGPIELKYRAIGDIAVFVAFGSAMTLGVYMVQTGTFSWAPVVWVIPLGLLVDAILHGNNLRDVGHDKAAGVRTLAGILGESGAQKMYYLLVLGAFVLQVFFVFVAGLPKGALASLVTLPIAIKLCKKVASKSQMPLREFATIDAETAQLHLMFGLSTIIGMIVSSLLTF